MPRELSLPVYREEILGESEPLTSLFSQIYERMSPKLHSSTKVAGETLIGGRHLRCDYPLVPT